MYVWRAAAAAGSRQTEARGGATAALPPPSLPQLHPHIDNRPQVSARPPGPAAPRTCPRPACPCVVLRQNPYQLHISVSQLVGNYEHCKEGALTCAHRLVVEHVIPSELRSEKTMAGKGGFEPDEYSQKGSISDCSCTS